MESAEGGRQFPTRGLRKRRVDWAIKGLLRTLPAPGWSFATLGSHGKCAHGVGDTGSTFQAPGRPCEPAVNTVKRGTKMEQKKCNYVISAFFTVRRVEAPV